MTWNLACGISALLYWAAISIAASMRRDSPTRANLTKAELLGSGLHC